MATTQQINLQELVVLLSKATDAKGNQTISPEMQELIENGSHHVHMPDSLKPSAAEAFQLAFEGIGGLPRLLRWADRYPASFYKLYARQTIPTIAPVLPRAPEAATQDWPEWLTNRRLAYQEDDLTDIADGDEDDTHHA